jgi:manganese/iron transport system permease protein
MAAIAAALLLFVLLLLKEMRAILFSREHAAAAGIHVTVIWTAFLILASAVLTINFKTVGGLMIYSLLINPAAAAFQLVKGHRKTLLLSAVFGAVSGLGGFLIALLAEIPTGAAIVILSSLLVMAACLVGNLRKRRRAGNT